MAGLTVGEPRHRLRIHDVVRLAHGLILAEQPYQCLRVIVT